MKGQQAIPPVSSLTVSQFIEKVKDAGYKEIVEKAEKEDKQIVELLSSQAFEKFKALVEERIEFLKNMVDPDSKQSLIDVSDTPERIGTKYLIVSFAIDQLRKMISLPETIQNARRTGDTISKDDQGV